MGNTMITEDPRIDPRIKAVLGAIDLGALSDAESREQVLEDATTEQVIAVRDLATRGGTVEPQLWRAGAGLSCHRARPGRRPHRNPTRGRSDWLR